MEMIRPDDRSASRDEYQFVIIPIAPALARRLAPAPIYQNLPF
jgi:hypothetical protein